MSRSYRIRSLALLTLALAIALALALALRGGSGPDSALAAATAAPGDATAPSQRTLTFDGTGQVQMQPDTAEVDVSVNGSGTSSDAAQAVATAKMTTVLQALRSLTSVHISDSDLQTQDIDTSPDWQHEGRYVSDQSLSVTLHDPSQSGVVIEAATAAGADSVDGPTFSLEQQSAAYRDALRSAIGDARSKAEAAASAMGVQILGTAAVTENSDQGGPIMYAAASAAKATASAPPPVQVGPVSVSADVTVTFIYSPPAGG